MSARTLTSDDLMTRLHMTAMIQSDGAPLPRTRELALFARLLMRMRSERDQQFLPGLFQDPAWDIMLDLFVARVDGHDLSVSAVCVGCRAASATTLRYLAVIQEAGLVERKPDPSDRRRSYVRMTAEGSERMKRALTPCYERLRGLFEPR